MGVMVMEMFLARAGKAVFAIMLHAGQQEVAMKSSFPGTSSRKSWAFVHGAQVSTDGDLHDIVEADGLQGSLQLAGGSQRGELVDKGGSDQCIDAVAAVEALDQLIDLALVGNSAEGAQFTRH